MRTRLLEQGNKPEEAALQTKLLEINLRAAPQVSTELFIGNLLVSVMIRWTGLAP